MHLGLGKLMTACDKTKDEACQLLENFVQCCDYSTKALWHKFPFMDRTDNKGARARQVESTGIYAPK